MPEPRAFSCKQRIALSPCSLQLTTSAVAALRHEAPSATGMGMGIGIYTRNRTFVKSPSSKQRRRGLDAPCGQPSGAQKNREIVPVI